MHALCIVTLLSSAACRFWRAHHCDGDPCLLHLCQVEVQAQVLYPDDGESQQRPTETIACCPRGEIIRRLGSTCLLPGTSQRMYSTFALSHT